MIVPIDLFQESSRDIFSILMLCTAQNFTNIRLRRNFFSNALNSSTEEKAINYKFVQFYHFNPTSFIILCKLFFSLIIEIADVYVYAI